MGTSPFLPLRELPTEPSLLKSGDTLVLVGELFNRGYANGLVEAAQRQGCRIIQATVGRRDQDDQLRALNPEELASQPFECVNVPLEAGFDFEKAQDGLHLIERLKPLKLQEWQDFELAPDLLEECREKARTRLQKGMSLFCKKIEELVPTGNIVFAHLMAGGVPRSKPVLALLNRTVKGTGEKFFSSQLLWESQLGQVIASNFYEVTAHSFSILLEASASLRSRMKAQGRQVGYTAYGYHGTEIMIGSELRWQSYTPYLQGWAKIALENYSILARSQGIYSTVYNCPEILTNSSSIFQGVEVPLYSLLTALKHYAPEHSVTTQTWALCQSRLKPGVLLDEIVSICESVLKDSDVTQFFDYNLWPAHNTQAQLAKILQASDQLISAHQDIKSLMTADLSEIVLRSCGNIMLNHISQFGQAVVWLGHDIVTKAATE